MLFILLPWFVTFAIASSVSVKVPLDNQLPPTARINNLYSWTFSQNSFVSDSNASLVYSVSSLPKWLTFDPGSRTFQGTPSAEDEGHPEITVSAQDSTKAGSVSSWFSFCVSAYSPPSLHIPLDQQFKSSNPSLSSVFFLANDSALLRSNPALRIPPAWSFSIGIESDTFSGNLHYAALQTDGSPLPSWVKFNPTTITFDGFTPSHPSGGLLIASLAIHVTDNDGYSSAALPFDIIVAEHELRSTHSLPTINITASTPFSMSLNSALDFSGVLVDAEPIQSSNISTLSIDVSQYGDWLQYDGSSRQLSGTPPDNLVEQSLLPSLPVTITTEFNQTVHTNVSIAIVPSYFIAETLSSLYVKPGEDVRFSLANYLSNRDDLGNRLTDVDLSAAFDPESAGQYLHFNNITTELTGTIPSSVDYESIQVTFTAFSQITHSTSHASLDLDLDGKNNNALNPSDIPSSTRSKLLLGVGIAFGIIGGLFILLVSLALCRRCTRVQDTALEGEEGRRGWTEEEKKWYGLGEEQVTDSSSIEERMVVNFRQAPGGGDRKYGSLGLRTKQPQGGEPSNLRPSTDAENVQSPGNAVMRKGEFFDKLRSTVRVVSDKYRTIGERIRPRKPRPVIGKPVLIADIEGLPATDIRDPVLCGPPASFSIGESPSSSTQAPSIPTRRADFGPPSRSPLSDKRTGSMHGNKHSVDSVVSSPHSMISRSSMDIHAHEAVVHTARALSVRSGKSVSFPYPPQTTDAERPRLVPFTKSSQVPVPQIPSRANSRADRGGDDTVSGRRVMSLTAKVEDAKPPREDDLTTAISYVRTFGSDPIDKEPHSFYSLESSHGNAAIQGGAHAQRFLARVGERFIFTICVTEMDRPEVRLVSGEPLPEFVRVNVRSGDVKGIVQLWGTPQPSDIGEIHIGVYDRDDGHCIGRAIAEVVARA